MQILKNIQITIACSFGNTRTGKTVTATILDASGNVVASGYTAGAVVELGNGYYGIAISFSSKFAGYIRWNNTTDGIVLHESLVIVENNSEILRKIETNRWKISSNQLVIYDDDKLTPIYTFNLFLAGIANGDTPDERVPV